MNTRALPSHARAVVGGGCVIGCSTAYHLARLGWSDVVVVESGEFVIEQANRTYAARASLTPLYDPASAPAFGT